jgi:hypothetical protein
MVLVWLRGLRNLRTKFARPPQPFPPRQPRAHKIKPKTLRTYYEGAAKSTQILFAASTYRFSFGLAQLYLDRSPSNLAQALK